MKIFFQEKTKVEIPTQQTNYIVGSDLLAKLDGILTKHNMQYSSFLILSDKKAFSLFGDKIITSLQKLGKPVITSTIVSSEQNKELNKVTEIVKPYFQQGFNRNTCLICLGGGIITDIGGFIGSILLRGIDCVLLPTTLLAQIDAAIGGKTGVNFSMGKNIYKNMLGDFKQPALVISDVDTLTTLPEKEIRNGLGEMVKYWIGWEKPSFDELLTIASSPKSEELAQIINMCQKIKIETIKKDPQDILGEREKLNLGHTIGHAIEGASNGKLSHGEAVSIGLVSAAKLSLWMDMLSDDVFENILKNIISLGLPIQVKDIDKREVLSAMSLDKKGGTFVLIKDFGSLITGVKVEEELVKKVISEVVL